MEGSTKPRRPNYQPYIPVHRRNQQEQSLPQSAISRPIQREDSDIKRRGRGQFRAPSTDDSLNNDSIKPDIIQNPSKKNEITDLATKVANLSTEADMKSEEKEKEDWEEDWETAANDVEIKPSTIKSSSTTKQNLTKATVIADDDVTTVLDCYDFPSSFKTHNLQDMFKEYESIKGGYSIKWMDDTRALIVFEHPYTAKKAYIDNLNNPLLKIRPYKGQIDKKTSGPVPRRPVTTDMVARRLVHGALGVRTTKTAEQRQAEKELLKAAKEKKLAEKANSALRAQQIANAFDE